MASVVSGLMPRALRFRLFETFRIASERVLRPDRFRIRDSGFPCLDSSDVLVGSGGPRRILLRDHTKMSESQNVSSAGPSWVPLAPRERRVLGVMVEKAKTTPEYYPLTIAAIVTACNQKSNRDPVTNYDADDVEETLHSAAEEGGGDPGRGGRPGRALEAHALRLAEGEQGRAGGHGRAAAARPADRGRPPGPGEPDGAARGPAGAPGDPRSAGLAGPGAVPVAAGPEARRVRGARSVSAGGARSESARRSPAGRRGEDESPSRLSTGPGRAGGRVGRTRLGRPRSPPSAPRSNNFEARWKPWPPRCAT